MRHCLMFVSSTFHIIYSDSFIRESIGSLCRDGTDIPRPPYV